MFRIQCEPQSCSRKPEDSLRRFAKRAVYRGFVAKQLDKHKVEDVNEIRFALEL